MPSLLGTFCILHGSKWMKKAEGPRVTSQDPDTSAENTDKPLINYEANVRKMKTPQNHTKKTQSIHFLPGSQDLAPGSSGYKRVTAGTRKHQREQRSSLYQTSYLPRQDDPETSWQQGEEGNKKEGEFWTDLSCLNPEWAMFTTESNLVALDWKEFLFFFFLPSVEKILSSVVMKYQEVIFVSHWCWNCKL